MADALAAPAEDNSLLIVDDDAPFRLRLARAMEKRGFAVIDAETIEEGMRMAREHTPAHAVVALKLADGSGLDIVSALREARLRLLLAVRDAPVHITFIALVLTLLATIALKVVSGREGTPLRGGWPSGHAGIAFAAWMAIAFVTAGT